FFRVNDLKKLARCSLPHFSFVRCTSFIPNGLEEFCRYLIDSKEFPENPLGRVAFWPRKGGARVVVNRLRTEIAQFFLVLRCSSFILRGFQEDGVSHFIDFIRFSGRRAAPVH